MTAPVYAPARRRQTGFTLIELLVVVAIIGLLAGVGIPQYQKYVERAAVTADYATVNAFRTAIDAELFDTKHEKISKLWAAMDLSDDEEGSKPELSGDPKKEVFLTKNDVQLTRDTATGEWSCENKHASVQLKGCKTVTAFSK